MALLEEVEDADWDVAQGNPHLQSYGPIRSIASSSEDLYYATCSHIWRVNHNEKDTLYLEVGDLICTGYKDGHKYSKARVTCPTGLYWYEGQLLFCDHTVIRTIDGDYIKTIAGCGKIGWIDGPAKSARFIDPNSIVVFRGLIYVACNESKAIRCITPEGMVSTIGTVDRNGKYIHSDCLGPNTLCASASSLFMCYGGIEPKLARIDPDSSSMSHIAIKKVCDLSAAVYDPFSDTLLVTDRLKRCIWRINPSDPTQIWPAVANKKMSHVMSAHLEEPTVLHLTQAGALHWTNSKSGYTYYIESISLPPIKRAKENKTEFSSLLDCPTFSDLQLHHKASDKIFYLHSDLLEPVYGLESLKTHLSKLEECELPGWSIETFLLLLYGSPKAAQELSDRFSSPIEIVRILYLFDLIDMDPAEEVVHWTKTCLINSLEDAGPATAWNLFNRIIKECYRHFPSIELVCWYLRSTDCRKASNYNANLVQIENEDLRAIIKSKIRGTDLIHIVTQSDQERKSNSSLTEHLEDLAKSLVWGRSSSTLKVSTSLSVTKGNFTILISKRKGMIYVHDWVLYRTWSYFKRVVDAGLKEMQTRKLKLPAGFPPSLLVCVLKILYTGGTVVEEIEFNQDCAWFIEHGGEFDFINPEGLPRPGFESIYEHCVVRRRYAQHFEATLAASAAKSSKAS